MPRTYKRPKQLIKHTKISYSTASLVFHKFSFGTYRNSLNRGTSKLRHSKYLKKYEPYQFDIFCLESTFQDTRAQYLKKIYLCLEDNRSSFSRVSLKSETKDTRPETTVLFCLRKMFFGKQKFDIQPFKMNRFIFEFKQLKMNKFITSMWPLIISTSNATLEVPSVRLWPCSVAICNNYRNLQ